MNKPEVWRAVNPPKIIETVCDPNHDIDIFNEEETIDYEGVMQVSCRLLNLSRIGMSKSNSNKMKKKQTEFKSLLKQQFSKEMNNYF